MVLLSLQINQFCKWIRTSNIYLYNICPTFLLRVIEKRTQNDPFSHELFPASLQMQGDTFILDFIVWTSVKLCAFIVLVIQGLILDEW